MNWKEQMEQARGIVTIDLALRNAQLVNVISGEIHQTDIGVHQGKFVGIGDFPHAEQIIDLNGKYVVPGLIDGHVHIESSHLCPQEFCSVLLAHGVTTAVVDPHEIANVAGEEGISYILDSVEGLPINIFLLLPSCVPATELETSGARLDAQTLANFLGHPKVYGLGEVMDSQAVLTARPEMVAKLELPVALKDGHAPGMHSQDLNAYFLAGMHTDHECSTPEEARERLRRGFYVMLREGSAAKDLLGLLPAVSDYNGGQFLLVTDDRHSTDLLREGSIDHLVRLAIKAGQPPVRVIQMATVNAARALGLVNLGAVAPGYQADFVILNDLTNFSIEAVYWHGTKVSQSGERPVFSGQVPPCLENSVKLGDWSAEKLAVKIPQGNGSSQADNSGKTSSEFADSVAVRVIGVQKHSLVTAALWRNLLAVAGVVMPDPRRGIAKLVVIERHNGSGRTGVAFVEGLGLTRGAVASTVAHDSHNLIAAGMSDSEIALAIRTCVQMGGGLCLVDGDQVLGKLPLPIAGLMSKLSVENVAANLEELQATGQRMGIFSGDDPFMTLAFLSLPVIPELKLTDHGLIDVNRQLLLGLFAD